MKQADCTITNAEIKTTTLPTTESSTAANTQKRLQFSVINGRLNGADWLPSPNFNSRPTQPPEPSTRSDTGDLPHKKPLYADVNVIVIHNISLPPNEFAKTDANGMHYVKALFTNQLDWDAHPYFQSIRGIEVSAHVLIERCGKVTQFVNFNDRAWHAGRSSYLGRQAVNDFSIGIELEGSDFTQFTDAQYQALAEVIVAIYHAYPKTRRHLTGHSDIAPVRKTDPGDFFEWQRIRQLVSEHMQ